jgi:hypothetical protein
MNKFCQYNCLRRNVLQIASRVAPVIAKCLEAQTIQVQDNIYNVSY